MNDHQPKDWAHKEIMGFGETKVIKTAEESAEVTRERERSKKLLQAIEFALIYDPYHDQYKIKHSVIPKLLKAKAEYEAGSK